MNGNMPQTSNPDINYDVATRDFKYYIFDRDDNILHMPTKIHLEEQDEKGLWRSVEVSTSVFAIVRGDPRYRMPPGGREEAFREFKDVVDDAGDISFIRDTKAALQRVKNGEKPGPSFQTLRKTLREGRIFAIVTARGHASDTLREAVKIFIDEVLSPDERNEMMRSLRGYRWWLDRKTEFGTDEEELDYYLSMCRYHAVTNPEFFDQMKRDDDFGGRYAEASSSQRPELAKEFAIRDFVEHVFHVLQRTGGLGRPVSVGFSDDDAGNVIAVSDYIRGELVKRFRGFKFVVYDTSDASLDKGRKVTVAGQLSLPGF